jgi:hypothetical protein
MKELKDDCFDQNLSKTVVFKTTKTRFENGGWLCQIKSPFRPKSSLNSFYILILTIVINTLRNLSSLILLNPKVSLAFITDKTNKISFGSFPF